MGDLFCWSDKWSSNHDDSISIFFLSSCQGDKDFIFSRSLPHTECFYLFIFYICGKILICCPFPFQVHLLWWSSICHRFTTLWAHPSWHHQGHCYPLCPPEWLPCGPKIWLGLSWLACGKTQILKTHAQYHYKFCVDLQMKPYVAHVTRVWFYRSMRLIRLWGSKGRKMWPRWASQSITSSAEALSWDIPKSGRWVSLEY